jgi:hypothetical protein
MGISGNGSLLVAMTLQGYDCRRYCRLRSHVGTTSAIGKQQLQ